MDVFGIPKDGLEETKRVDPHLPVELYKYKFGMRLSNRSPTLGTRKQKTRNHSNCLRRKFIAGGLQNFDSSFQYPFGGNTRIVFSLRLRLHYIVPWLRLKSFNQNWNIVSGCNEMKWLPHERIFGEHKRDSFILESLVFKGWSCSLTFHIHNFVIFAWLNGLRYYRIPYWFLYFVVYHWGTCRLLTLSSAWEEDISGSFELLRI